MLRPIHLVFRVGAPAQIADTVVRRVPVVVACPDLRRHRRAFEAEQHELAEGNMGVTFFVSESYESMSVRLNQWSQKMRFTSVSLRLVQTPDPPEGGNTIHAAKPRNVYPTLSTY